jgi:hypothetical protein
MGASSTIYCHRHLVTKASTCLILATPSSDNLEACITAVIRVGCKVRFGATKNKNLGEKDV